MSANGRTNMRTKEEIATELLEVPMAILDGISARRYTEALECLGKNVATEISRLEQQIENKMDKPSARDTAITKALEEQL